MHMQIIHVHGVDVDSYTEGNYHLHRYPPQPTQWELTRLGFFSFSSIQAGMDWATARELFCQKTGETISDNW